MHMREDGKWYEGVHPSLAIEESKSATRRFVERTTGWVRKLPFLSTRSALVVLALLLATGLTLGSLAIVFSPGSDLPTALPGRVELVCRAVLENDGASLRLVTASGSSSAAEEWQRIVRKTLDEKSVQSGPVAAVEYDVLTQRVDERIAVVSIAFTMQDGDTNDVLAYWILSPDNLWMLDGERTLEIHQDKRQR